MYSVITLINMEQTKEQTKKVKEIIKYNFNDGYGKSYETKEIMEELMQEILENKNLSWVNDAIGFGSQLLCDIHMYVKKELIEVDDFEWIETEEDLGYRFNDNVFEYSNVFDYRGNGLDNRGQGLIVDHGSIHYRDVNAVMNFINNYIDDYDYKCNDFENMINVVIYFMAREMWQALLPIIKNKHELILYASMLRH